jgi:hypothetical protein
MEAIAEFFRKIGTHNLLILGIVILVSWLLISGFLKGWKKRGHDKDSEGGKEGGEDSVPDP